MGNCFWGLDLKKLKYIRKIGKSEGPERSQALGKAWVGRARLPADHRGTPGEARSESREEEQLPLLDAPHLQHLVEQERDRGGRGVPLLLDVVVDLRLRDAERSRDELVDPQVRLVKQEVIDVV